MGLFYLDRTEKPVLKAMTAFSEFVEALPFRAHAQAHDGCGMRAHPRAGRWAAAYGAFILARQAHVDLTFAWADGPSGGAPLICSPA